MSLAQFIQDAWQQQAKWLVVLRPLSLLYRGVSLLNQNLYRSGIKTAYTAPVPVMVIGNITVGGSGALPVDTLPSYGLAIAPTTPKRTGRALAALYLVRDLLTQRGEFQP